MSLFILSTMFLCIIMLNLIIAVISDTYSRLEGTSQNVLYQNFSDLIDENEYLVPKSEVAQFDAEGSYLYIAKIDENDGAQGDQMERQLRELKDTITQRISTLERTAKELSRTLASTIELNKEKVTQMYIEDAIKNEISFKTLFKKNETNSNFGSPNLLRVVSNTNDVVQRTEEGPKSSLFAKGAPVSAGKA